ncbi:hypothetical protein O3M35_004636 [Rhynocoris fuscipes]|uniref:Potassium channel domain-containing protein n=1 Tax=Rhynocoris fuscipes TaxID=488301 RepID=A0AAW1CIR6_9HEMI
MEDTVSDRYYYDPVEQKTWIDKTLDFIRAFLALMFSNIGVIGLVIGYTILGSFLFKWIEGPYEAQRKLTEDEVIDRRKQLTNKLWKFTCEMNIFAEDKWKEIVQEEVYKFQKFLVKAIQDKGYEGEGLTVNRWSFSAAFLFSLTVITSIGYGNLTPKTGAGKMATILYAIFGMPLFLLYLTTIGRVMSTSFKWTYSKCCKCQPRRRRARFNPRAQVINEEGSSIHQEISVAEEYIDSSGVDQTTVPIFLCLLIIIGYLYGGAILFSQWEQWDMLDGAYFCFVSLSTIGFGDIVPGMVISEDGRIEVKFIFCAMYLLLGMAVIAMCFNLMQEEVIQKIRNAITRLKRLFGCIKDEELRIQ